MKGHIKTDRLKFKVGSMEWMNFFGLPVCLIFLGLMFFTGKMFLSGSVLLIAGAVSYFVQLDRLKFKTFTISADLEDFKNDMRAMLTDNKWKIDYDNKSFLIATYSGGMFNLDMITLKFRGDTVKWNVIHNPGDHNSFAALLSLNRPGRKLIKQMHDNHIK